MRIRILSWGVLTSLFVVAACAPSRTIETTREAGASTGVSVPYSLPRGLMSVKVERDGKKAPKITFESLKLLPDPTARYVAQFNRRALRSDEFKLVLSDGLLSMSTNKVTDSTPQFVEELSNAISENLRLERTDNKTTPPPSGMRTDTLLLDPFRHAGTVANGVSVSFQDLNGNHIEHRPSYQTCPAGSLCFPLLIAVKAIVTARDTSGISRAELTTAIPDPSRVAAIDINRYACVTAQTDITFKDGILVDYNLNKPSELVECLSIPLDIISTIISAPVDAITGRQARINAEKGLLEAQKNLLTEQAALIAAQSNLQTAQQANVAGN